MVDALDNFSDVLERAMVHLQQSMQRERVFTVLVLTAKRAQVAATLQAHWQRHAPAQAQLHLVSFEANANPFAATGYETDDSTDTVSAVPRWATDNPAEGEEDVHTALTALLAMTDDTGVPLLPGVHRFEAPAHRLTVTRFIGPSAQTFSQLVAMVDLVLVDSTSQIAGITHYADSLLRIAAPELAVLAPQAVLEALQQAIRSKGARGVALHSVAQPWQMLLAQLHKPAKPSAASDRTAWVVGGGLAGAGVAYALALRGWQVHVTDPALAPDQPGPQAGHLAAALTPLISVDDNFKARLSRAGVYRAHQRWADFGPDIIPSRSGTLELARSKGHARDLLQAVRAMAYPQGWVRLSEPQQAEQQAGVAVLRPGAYFAKGMTVSPPNLIRRLLSHPNIVCHGQQVDAVQKGAQGWQLRSHGSCEPLVIAECDTVILAAAARTPALLAASGLDQQTLRSGRTQAAMPAIMSMDTLAGQVMHVPTAMLPQVPVSVIGAEGYFLPPVQGQCVLGSTYEREPAAQGCTRLGQQHIVSKLAPALDAAALQPVVDALSTGVPLAGLPQAGSRGEPAAVGETNQDAVGDNATTAGTPTSQQSDAPLFTGWAGSRAVIRGRLPAFGPVRHAPGLWLACGYASHGLTWSALAGDVIAAMLNAEPLPLERDLLQAVAPR
ncbi:FAD-dependent oxidoreductase [Advenella mimigardefordensis]|uniref:tRNA 5-methylaminomethyl-2-thiouridine biosynthesis bifunctional protein MnmC n=1 Tax=Advenella mimigardefordensis (strain DSM 17166 / LMG 22922 / DPN7) TaxID=1247726 RepID=W0PC75_ADVMD|nr:FAD-dependent oxidoreductase [Advenella mimigardefordensis]AHG63087.1 tRNA 5-methylaminomethyl-2-thiouridine biosynthesis bifunctional protein MnmC [Advenella mimigardefordensis DPN7]